MEQALPWTVLLCHTPTPLTSALVVHYDNSMRYVAAILTPGPVLLAGDRFKRRPGRDNSCLGVDPIFTHFAICLELELPDAPQHKLKRASKGVLKDFLAIFKHASIFSWQTTKAPI